VIKKCSIIVVAAVAMTYVLVKYYDGIDSIRIYSPYSIFFAENKRTYFLESNDQNGTRKAKFVQLSSMRSSQQNNCIKIKQDGSEKFDLLEEFYICNDKKGNFFQLHHNKKAIIYQNTFSENTFHTNRIFDLFDEQVSEVDAWCTQTLEQKTIFHQERNIVRLNCSALYDTTLKEGRIDKKVVRKSMIFAEGLGLYMMEVKMYNENNQTQKSIKVILDKVDAI
jgi:hypothetical protein